MRARRFRFTTMGFVKATAVCAVALGLLVEEWKIKRTQASWRRQALVYARLEKAENTQKTYFVAEALKAKQFAEQIPRTSPGERAQDRFFPSSGGEEELIASRNRCYDAMLALENTYLKSADEARINSERYSELRRQFGEAADRVWLPYTSNPLGREHSWFFHAKLP
jgi:hypothetical protein